MKKNSFTIYLEVNIKVLTKRLEKSKKRPLLKNKNIKKELQHLLSDRINTKDEWLEMFELLIAHSEEISQINTSFLRSTLQQSMKELYLKLRISSPCEISFF